MMFLPISRQTKGTNKKLKICVHLTLTRFLYLPTFSFDISLRVETVTVRVPYLPLIHVAVLNSDFFERGYSYDSGVSDIWSFFGVDPRLT